MLLNSSNILEKYETVRHKSEQLVSLLSAEDAVVQSMPDASPAKWHIGHVTWFFERFLLQSYLENYVVYDPEFNYIFNSYYESEGVRQPRAQRGLLTRPTLNSVLAYRKYVDEHVYKLLLEERSEDVLDIFNLGLAHEEQHQELLLMDILNLFSFSPLAPAYDSTCSNKYSPASKRFKPIAGGLVRIGHEGGSFAFDNEGPHHAVFVRPFEICESLVTNGDWIDFIDVGGYSNPLLWLSEGWAQVVKEGWCAPLYWKKAADQWSQFTLSGLQILDRNEPVRHISYYEASAFAVWANARLPTEAEWETAERENILLQSFDECWQWTQSAYSAYPGFSPALGAVGEYNGKFMVNQMVLKGASRFTPESHSRCTYRNFFPPEKRWMVSGLRLARDSQMAADVHHALRSPVKQLSPKYLYDAQGSKLFEAISRTYDYYPTRVETALLEEIATEISERIPQKATLVEFGSGAGDKTRILLSASPQLRYYVPVDISSDILCKSSECLAVQYPHLSVLPVHHDFMTLGSLPHQVANSNKIGFFPGSTIGNFELTESVDFLQRTRRLLGGGSHFVIGIDLVKEVRTLVRAYNDCDGVTAQFNLNLLRRINIELGADFDLDAFEHLAFWNSSASRMEMHLVSKKEQVITVAGLSYKFKVGESLHTESSVKYTIQSFTETAEVAGWDIAHFWVSRQFEFAVFLLRC